MNYHAETVGDYIKRNSNWHKHFALFPVFSYEDRRVYWLESVQRKLKSYSTYTGSKTWEYKKGEL